MEQKLKLIIEIEVKLTMEQKLKLKTDIEVELAVFFFHLLPACAKKEARKLSEDEDRISRKEANESVSPERSSGSIKQGTLKKREEKKYYLGDGKSENSLQQWRVIGIDLLRSDSQGGPISSTNSSASLGAWCHRDASASTAGTGSTSGGGTWQPPPGGHSTQNCTLFNFDILKLGLSSRSKGKLKLNLIMKRRLILKPKRQGACPERLIRFTPTFSRVSVSCPPRRIRHRRLVFLPFDAGSD
ncbi:unnamed protein product [Nesidiocoris tenuis]|uniref:Uncharacterized protein n=1 Tax=Nesidiocoris tenuis TaxID=355587 RepID=A0A6H5GEG5_9HEMI|nr:unnamed protein product [Nesidiocoris tenuis]